MSKPKVDLAGSVDDLIADLERERAERIKKQPPNVFALLTRIYDVVAGMRSDGWTDAEICHALKGRGVEISMGTLRSYMQKIAREQKGARGTRRRKKGEESSTESAASSDNAGTNSDPTPAAKPAAPQTFRPSTDAIQSRKPPALDA